ncbi:MULTISPECIES: diaminopimelate decarboxylase [unclassified Oceanispirochaeta]|uniref:diaminopimelate decarboxylase n=1 Tax=unclassified Oceanispirochaeta TaxID=2635722 RepID=UPI000E08F295|nr:MULTISPECIES: diaminopimelate decarboxylase [unclassified Oceanispirochaeta]MBF9015268.1 diaminopimelate decarboxylase [Oceanispirochaeta sp. M2]NPD71726.1 diaminopimelate decarboxylase [Oceanispirochaeta sp. M1]RDG32919.1 diaminopimelate decarboxylase [Oceanispirochaeta sp. M1]
MTKKTIPFTKDDLDRISADHSTPFHIYDKEAIEKNGRALMDAFSWVPGGFKNFFAVKALPNPYIIKMLKALGMGADCSSLPELILAEKAGLKGEEIMFTSNDTPMEEYEKALELGAIINLDDITHLDYLHKGPGLPQLICFRYNPGPLKEGNAIIGSPEEAKYGFTREQLKEGYRKAASYGVKRFGLHTMVASNELESSYFVETAILLLDLVREISEETGISFEFINLGGGVGIPYKPEDNPVDIDFVSKGIEKAYKEKLEGTVNEGTLRVLMECGRVITGPYGYLVTRAIHKKDTYKHYIGVDACMTDLMRPGMYGAYHHITIPGKEGNAADHKYDVAGSLCENNDKFAIDRYLPFIENGDYIVIHDTGAHGHAMGFNYNGKLRHAELILNEDKSVRLIRRAETIEDYFATLDFTEL